MAKTILIAAVLGCIDYKGESYTPGCPVFECETKEAKRLIELGVAAYPDQSEKNVAETGMPDAATFELLAAIAAATSLEELASLMPEQEPAAEIVAAFAARGAELEIL